ncbi:L-ascorbate metabolism protein UlaG (beta-lactamase superfamily) [Neolewinella xylanilytica]|uniref:L-ascorbate metabolism protein UlaG (Beta-lactamase superfamily) n=1 Tax=Neolewinella xylanilytica TaxID=1514080 RepID=A0A2S6I404_9BACT|nr:MBL fold metallo-hydrolase [Neolewinella xylanilytica]PPK85906.1 L-ascorbate metabolism protein UlaG (beta-lactamase superfamily) [Neolewinella xylanilytica]
MKPHWLVGLALLPVGYVARKLRNDPQFGASLAEMKQNDYQGTTAWKMGRFRNIDKTKLQEDLRSLMGDLLGYLKAKNTQPTEPLPVAEAGERTHPDPDTDYLTWYGHSAIRLETGGKTLLIDPMLGEWVAPVPFLGHRFPYEDYHPLKHIGTIDLIMFSHDHYDHLDYDTLMAVKDRTQAYLVPLGIGAHLRSWGIAADKITEIDWWETVKIQGLTITATPARHFSGRSPATRNKTLWCGFVIQTAKQKIYFGGDSGYGRHFQEIGQRFGPFDLTMLDSGQYHDRWKNVHMQPEEALRANRELGGKQLLPIHWGGFSLSDHPWYDPVERIVAADTEQCVLTPMIGQRFTVGDGTDCRNKWWNTSGLIRQE